MGIALPGASVLGGFRNAGRGFVRRAGFVQ
jgi:hypothetical protein